MVAHDLRNPLGPIAMAVDAILEVPPPEEKRVWHLGAIKREGERMNRLIQDLLDVARMESGRLSTDPRPVEVRALLERVSEQMRQHVEDKGLQPYTYLGEGVPRIQVDPDRIEQVFSNLIGNAIRFTPKGGHVTLRAVRDGEKVRMSVADTGTGIPPEQQSKIFDRMWQAHRGGMRGIGLGLTSPDPSWRHTVSGSGSTARLVREQSSGSRCQPSTELRSPALLGAGNPSGVGRRLALLHVRRGT